MEAIHAARSAIHAPPYNLKPALDCERRAGEGRGYPLSESDFDGGSLSGRDLIAYRQDSTSGSSSLVSSPPSPRFKVEGEVGTEWEEFVEALMLYRMTTKI